MKNENKMNYEELIENLDRFANPQISFVPEEVNNKTQLFQFLDRLDKEELGIESYRFTFKPKKKLINTYKEDLWFN